MRKADLKLAKLREVVEKLQKGEPVDVEKELGTGDETSEREWEEALKEIEKEDREWRRNKRRKDQELEEREVEDRDASPVNAEVGEADQTSPTPIRRAPGFY